MTLRRRGNREIMDGGAAELIRPLLSRTPAMRELRRASLRAGGIDRIGGVPSGDDYRSPSGLISPYENFITVAKDGGDFQSIRDALDSVQDANATNLFCIFVYPGVYDEQVVMKEYVSLVGLDRDVCVIQSDDYLSLVTMARYSNLNEISVINQSSGPSQAVLVPDGVDNWFIDTCRLSVDGSDAVNALTALQIAGGSISFRVLDSHITAENSSFAGLCYGVEALCVGAVVRGFIDNCLIELPNADSTGVAIYVCDNSLVGGKYLKVVHTYINVQNNVSRQDVVYADGQKVEMHLEHSSISHKGTAGTGLDVLSTRDAIPSVRADMYGTWGTATGGQSLPLAGDRPRLECKRDATNFTITAGAGVYEVDPNGTFTIDLPCQSDLLLNVEIRWTSDAARAPNAFRAQVLVDGVVAGITLGYISSLMNFSDIYSLTVCKHDLTTGVHTITLQVCRNNAADTIQILTRQITCMSDPWP